MYVGYLRHGFMGEVTPVTCSGHRCNREQDCEHVWDRCTGELPGSPVHLHFLQKGFCDCFAVRFHWASYTGDLLRSPV